MGLITTGLGHLTIITMGLGTSIRIARQQRRRKRFGIVEFENVPSRIEATDYTREIDIDEEEVKTKDTDIAPEEIVYG